MRRILVLTFTDLSRDPRVRRQCAVVSRFGELVVASPGSNPFEFVEHVRLESGATRSLASRLLTAFRLSARAFEDCYWSQRLVRDAVGKLAGRPFDLIVANDLECLPLALHLANEAPVIFDAHEYAPAEFDDQLVWRVLVKPYRHYLCARYMRRCTAVTTVSQGIADEYARNYCDEAVVFPNACDLNELYPTRPEPGSIKLVHHGLALPSRCIDRMIDMFDFLDERFSLTFMLLPGPNDYLEVLKQRATKYRQINFADPVSVVDICKATNRFDMGLFLLPPSNFNYRHALPNKFFEFVQARLAIAIGPSPEMSRYVEKYDLGVISSDFTPENLATKLNGMTSEECWQYKQNAHATAPLLAFARFAKEFATVIGTALDGR